MLDLILSTEAIVDLNKELLETYNINTINMSFNIGEKEYNTLSDDSIQNILYDSMKKGIKTSTSNISIESYKEYFIKLLKENNNKTILHISFSSGLSSTYLNAYKASKELENIGKIIVIDSLCACSGVGLLLILTRLKMEEINTIIDLIDYIELTKHKISHTFTVDTLKYLNNGGRFKKYIYTAANILSIKPIMRMDDLGKLALDELVISRKKSLDKIFDNFLNNRKTDDNHIIISHANALKDALYLKNKIIESTGIEPIITNLGVIIGCHSGEGTIAIYYLSKRR